jgi:hypothetical protein
MELCIHNPPYVLKRIRTHLCGGYLCRFVCGSKGIEVGSSRTVARVYSLSSRNVYQTMSLGGGARSARKAGADCLDNLTSL